MLPIMVTMLPILVTLEKAMNRHMQQIDQQTGEVVEGFVAYVVPKQKRVPERMDGNGSGRNDDACSKQFNRQRHEGDVGNACTS